MAGCRGSMLIESLSATTVAKKRYGRPSGRNGGTKKQRATLTRRRCFVVHVVALKDSGKKMPARPQKEDSSRNEAPMTHNMSFNTDVELVSVWLTLLPN